MAHQQIDIEEMFEDKGVIGKGYNPTSATQVAGSFTKIWLEEAGFEQFEALNAIEGRLTVAMIDKIKGNCDKETFEIKMIQPTVRRMLSHVFKDVVDLLDERSQFFVMGGKFASSLSVPHEWNSAQCRVFFPFHGTPDIYVSFEDRHVKRSARTANLKLDVEASITGTGRIGVPAEIKPEFKDNFKDNQAFLIQTAIYLTHFFFRVIPMLSENVIADIFPDQTVYSILATNKKLYVLAIDRKGNTNPSRFQCLVSPLVSVTENPQLFYRKLGSWFVWAANVAVKLLNLLDQLNGPCAVNCWLLPNAYEKLRLKIKDENGEFVACPSFFNPIYKSANYYFRVATSYWCRNELSKFHRCMYKFPNLFENWITDRAFVAVPDYGRPVQSTDISDIPELKSFLSQLLTVLSLLVADEFCHQYVRIPNVIRDFGGRYHLIDFDYANQFEDVIIVSHTSLSTPPEYHIHQTSDMWSLGVVVLNLVANDVSREMADLPDNWVDNINWRDAWTDDADRTKITDFLRGTIVIDPNARMTVADALALVNSW
jgi:hypothetical protein